MKAITLSCNANSRNRRKVFNGFKGEGTCSGWIKTSPYGTYTHKHTADEIVHMNRIHQAKVIGTLGKHAGSSRFRRLCKYLNNKYLNLLARITN